MSDTAPTILQLPFPPSVNNLFANAGRKRLARPEYKAWKKLAAQTIQGQGWEGRLHPKQTAAQIRSLADSHGWDAVMERYWWLERRTLDKILQRGRRAG